MKAAQLKKTQPRNAHQSQERILEAALKEFAAEGFAGARVDAIARRARINKRMLYHYFGDKKGLFQEVMRRKVAERSAWLASAPDDPVESLPYWFRLSCLDRDWLRLLEWEALQGDEQEVIEEKLRQESVVQAIDRLKQRQARGLLPADLDPGQLLLSIMGITVYPLAFPQIARLITGLAVSDPEFQQKREKFLRQFASVFQPPLSNGPASKRAAAPEDLTTTSE